MQQGYNRYSGLTIFNSLKINLRQNIFQMSTTYINNFCAVIYECLRLRYFQISELNESSGCHLLDRFVFYGNPSIIKSDWEMRVVIKRSNDQDKHLLSFLEAEFHESYVGHFKRCYQIYYDENFNFFKKSYL